MTKRKTVFLYLVGITLVVLLWHQVFLMTGVLWWNAPEPGQRLAAFPAQTLTPPDTRHVDLQAFLQTHPQWNPH